MTFESGT
jgi:ATP-grasp domain-containing protein